MSVFYFWSTLFVGGFIGWMIATARNWQRAQRDYCPKCRAILRRNRWIQ
jgi:hypothetical protein